MISSQDERYLPCRVLIQNHIPCYIWAEDALRYYGVRTAVFTLQIMVQDNEAAAKILTENDWDLQPDSVRPYSIGDAKAKFLAKSNATGEKQLITLLSSSEWTIAPPTADQNSMIPGLPELVDALIDKWLDEPADNVQFRIMLAVYLCYLYEYNKELKRHDFARELKFEHRQYHFDVLAGVTQGSKGFRKHQIKIRQLLRRGDFELCECSADRNDETIFTDLAATRLRVAMEQKQTEREEQ